MFQEWERQLETYSERIMHALVSHKQIKEPPTEEKKKIVVQKVVHALRRVIEFDATDPPSP